MSFSWLIPLLSSAEIGLVDSCNSVSTLSFLDLGSFFIEGFSFTGEDLISREEFDKTAAVIVEPVQGEGGIRPLADSDLKARRAHGSVRADAAFCDGARLPLVAFFLPVLTRSSS